MTKEELNQKAEKLAAKILELTGGALFLNLPFLARAVSSLPAVPYNGTYATDGKRFFYSPVYLLKRYKSSERLPAHDHLHLLMHCVFRHWYIGGGMDARLWDAACDIAVESLILDIGLFDGENKFAKAEVIKELGFRIRPLTAEKLYAYFKGLPAEVVLQYAELFRTDDHRIWYPPPDREYEDEEKQKTLGIGSLDDENGEDGQDENGKSGASPSNDDENKSPADDKDTDGADNNESGDAAADDEGDGGADEFGNTELSSLFEYSGEGENGKPEALKQLEEMWRDIARQLQLELGEFKKNAGRDTQNLVQTLEEVNRERYDYTDFLKKFAAAGEVMRQDAESFDTNYYSYGMELYGNVALIEPLEYKEEKRIRDFVVAIDTSGSVSGALVRRFMQKTYNILCSENSFFKHTNIYIIQCDTEVRDTAKITCRKDLEKYISEIELKGLGGTDLRPVFDHVRRLLDNKEFTDLKGLIYFTDGIGEFPKKKPPYETAFVFLRSDYETSGCPDVPPWAVKLILEDDCI